MCCNDKDETLQKNEDEEVINDKVNHDKALVIWNESQKIWGGPAEAYLRKRGVDTSTLKEYDNEVLRYHPSLYYSESHKNVPCLVAKVTNKNDEFIGIHRIYLTLEGGKFNQKPSKKSLGDIKGGGVQLTPIGPKMILCQGLEDGLILMQCCPDYGVWCFLGGNTSIALPEHVQEVVVAADSDAAGQKHARKIRRLLQADDRAVGICFPPEEKDFNELYLKDYDTSKIHSLIENTILEVSSYIAKKTAASVAFKHEALETEFLIERILPFGGVCILAGHPKVGKSWLALNFAVGIQLSEEVFGELQTKQVGVFLCSLEDNRQRLKSRYLKVSGGRLTPNGLFVKTLSKPLDQDGLEELKKELESSPEIKLLILDPFEKVRPQEQKGQNIYRADYKDIGLLKELAEEYEITVLLVHHLRKNASGSSVFDLNGSMGLSGAVDTIMILSKDDATGSFIFSVMGKDVEEQEFNLEFDSYTGRFSIAQKIEAIDTSLQTQILNFLRVSGKECTPKEISIGLDKNSESEKTMVRQQLKSLLEKQKVTQPRQGCYVINTQ